MTTPPQGWTPDGQPAGPPPWPAGGAPPASSPQTWQHPGAAPGQHQRTNRPGPITAAMVLWIIIGVLLVLSSLAGVGNLPETGDIARAIGQRIGVGLFAGLGIALIVLSVRLGRGSSGARVALTVLGVISMFGLVTIPLAVTALILQFRPSSSAWLATVAAARQPPRIVRPHG